MKFGLIYEIALPRQLEAGGKTEYDAYWEAIEQIKLAEELGFHSVWAVEHHFLQDLARCSAPEVFLAAVAQHTRRVRIGHGVVLLPAPFNHPVRVAERVATLDILSNGRVEFGTGRSITEEELGGFAIDPDDSRAMWEESLRIIPRMWTEPEFSGYQGRFVRIPPGRAVVPRPLQKPHPPIWMACTSPSSYALAGRYGLGLLSFTAGVTAGLKELVRTYREAIAAPEPVGGFVNATTASFCAMHCRQDDRLARERGGSSAMLHLGFMEQYYGRVFESRGYREFQELAARPYGGAPTPLAQGGARAATGSLGSALLEGGVDGLVRSGTICVGDPARCREIVAMYRDAGFEHYLALIQYGTLSAQETLASLRLFAEKVMPAFA
jgi:alkanesulfonate monooxygenase SsuD/methylene tetrahydromethanopterin reductase-like flavin-dependent oxidoreductase (luciferase family)